MQKRVLVLGRCPVPRIGSCQVGAMLVLLLLGWQARAEPEGVNCDSSSAGSVIYQSELPGVYYRAQRVLIYRGATFDPKCDVPADHDVVVVLLGVSNSHGRAVEATICSTDLCLRHGAKTLGVSEESSLCGLKSTSGSTRLAAHETRVFRKVFIAPAGATPYLLGYNDDDFAGRIALPQVERAAKGPPGRAKAGPAPPSANEAK